MKLPKSQYNIWLTTDTHFGHDKLVEYGRPVDFTEKIKYNLLQSVKSGDILIHLGDVSVGDDEYHHLWIGALPCKKILIRGNHDKHSNSWYYSKGWDFVCWSVSDKLFGKRIIFSHFPLDRNIFGGSDINIHGHLHDNEHRKEEVKEFYQEDFHVLLSLEQTNYQPVLLETLIKKVCQNLMKK